MNINWYPGHMVKTKKQITEDLKLIDVVLEILDARIPHSSRNPEINEIVKDKKKIILLNKSDLADDSQNKKWVKYFESLGTPTVLTDSNSGKGINESLKKTEEIMEETLNQSAQKGRIGRNIRVVILGIPNVGKSSFINRASKRTAATVGNKPGVTKQKQWIRLGGRIELLDTPGVLWPKFESEEVALNLSYTGTIKDELLDKTEVAYKLLEYLKQKYTQNLIERYRLNDISISSTDVEELMNIIGKKRGAIIAGIRIDYEKVANIVLGDFRSGKLGRITLEMAM